MADKPAGQPGKKNDPVIENRPADHGANNGVPPDTKTEEAAALPTSHRAETETSADPEKHRK